MKKLELHIDTSSRETVTVKLIGDGVNVEKSVEIGPKKAQAVLPIIKEILLEQKFKLSDITSISVHPGPGSFTGVRIGVAVANALATLLGVPLNGNAVGMLVTPLYEPSKFD